VGQQFILREHLRRVLAAGPFGGEAWEACVAAFLAAPGIPLLTQNGVSQGPAWFFLDLYTRREPTYPPEGDGQWGEDDLRRRLADLGDQRVSMIHVTDQTRSWAIYLNEELTTVLAYHGRLLPGVRYSPEADDDDLVNGTVIRTLLPESTRARVAKLDLTSPRAARVEVSDLSGRQIEITFASWRRIRHPSPSNETISGVDEVRGPSGRTWFVFRPIDAEGRVLALQAETASIRPL
jgi:hypothetical protein